MNQPKPFVRALKATCVALVLVCCGQHTFAQSVGVNTNNPDPSASLEVAGTAKGLLIPRISLTSLTDKTTIPNPATALLVYNTNAGLGKTGFYYNSGTKGNPVWANVSQPLTFPFSNSNNIAGTAFYLENGVLSSNAIGILSLSNYGTGLEGATAYGKGVLGYTFQNGVGVQAEAQSTTGTALKVIGRMNIAGPGQSPGAGKVLTSDESGNATWQNPSSNVAFSASGIKGGGSQNLPQGVYKVPFASEEYDFGNNYNDINAANHSTFVAPVTGIYQFSVSIFAVGTGQDPSFDLEVRLIRSRSNVPATITRAVQYLPGGDNMVHFTRDTNAQIGDMFYVEVYITKAGVKLQVQPEFNSFSGHLVMKQ